MDCVFVLLFYVVNSVVMLLLVIVLYFTLSVGYFFAWVCLWCLFF